MNAAASQTHYNAKGHRRPISGNVSAPAVDTDFVSWHHLELFEELCGHLKGRHVHEESLSKQRVFKTYTINSDSATNDARME